VNVRKIIRSTIIESGIKYGLSTGNWGIKTPKTKQGVAQVFLRIPVFIIPSSGHPNLNDQQEISPQVTGVWGLFKQARWLR
jgi:hypothetical protein